MPNTQQNKPIETRFFEKVEKDADTGCWNWTGATFTSPGGLKYAQFSDKKTVRGSRWAYEHWNGPIPEGYEIDHLCRNTLCVNPQHLEAVTPQENRRRSNNTYWVAHYTNVCKNGHEIVGDNRMDDSRGRKRCRVCWKAKVRENYLARKAKP